MSKMNGKIGFCLTAIFLAGVGVSALAANGAGQVASVQITSERIDWSPVVENNGFYLMVSGGGFELQRQFSLGETVSFLPFGSLGNPLPDGPYSWELRVIGNAADASSDGQNNGRPGDEVLDNVEPDVPASGTRPLVQSGTFTILDWMIVDSSRPEGRPVMSRGGRIERETPVLNTGDSSTVDESATSDTDGGDTQRDQQILDDLIVDGSACVGLDCVNGESFGFDTLRLKENNLRIKFQDTSTSASFPSNDWQITANDSANGGANKFSIDDISGGRTPFTIEAASPSNSLYVDSSGRIGLGTSNPVVELQVVNGDSPTMRLEQNGSSGFTAQTWDVAGNEANFFIRDVTNGSKLPFRIQPNSPANSIWIKTDRVHILGPLEPWHVVVYKSSGIADTDDIDHVAEADFNIKVTAVSCTSDDSTATIKMQRNGTDLISDCTCAGGGCSIDTSQDDFVAGDKLDFEVVAPGTATRISVHLKRSGT